MYKFTIKATPSKDCKSLAPAPKGETINLLELTNYMINFVSTTLDSLKIQHDLSPRNYRVNELLTGLVRFVTGNYDPVASANAMARLKEVGIAGELKTLCQEAEYLLELHYCQKLIDKCQKHCNN